MMQIRAKQGIQWLGGWLICAALAGCSALPTPPQSPARYDLGSPPALTGSTQPLSPVAITDIQAPLQADGATHLHYRLAYNNTHELHAYAHARWSLPPSQMVQQRLREHLSQGGRVVLSAEQGALAASIQGRQVPALRLALEEFSHNFSAPDQSTGWVRIRATLVNPAPQGDLLLAQQVFEARVPAEESNAASGAKALATGVDLIGQQMVQWVKTKLAH